MLSTTVEERVAIDVLARYGERPDADPISVGHEAGPVVLAANVDAEGLVDRGLAERAVALWIADLPDGIRSFGMFGGVGGLLAGLTAGVSVIPELRAMLTLTVDRLEQWVQLATWRTSLVAWRDYDLFNGPAGTVVGGPVTSAPTAVFHRGAAHLAAMSQSPGLEAFRAGTDIDPRSAFNVGRINTGMGHGVAGVVAALRHATEALDDGDRYRAALRHASAWLVNEAYLATGDFVTWPPIGRDLAIPAPEPDTRQAWCYGTPGIAWSLWEAGRVLGDDDLTDLAEAAMRSFCANFRKEVHLDTGDDGEEFGMCHGAAGTMMVADAFARHAGVSEAADLRSVLHHHLVEHADRIVALAARDMTILTGAPGIASALLSVEGGRRDWLQQFALR